MSSPWRRIPLGDAITFQRGFDLPHHARQPGTTPVVSSAGITDYHATAMCSPPGVITGRYGTIGELFYLDEPYWPLNTTLFVKEFRENDPRFVFYLLQRFDFESFSGKSGVPGVNRNDLHLEKISIPSLINEQRAIAAALADVDAAVVGLERLIAKKRDLKQAVMQQLLTGETRLPGFSGKWEVKRLGEMLKIRHGKSQKLVEEQNGVYPILATGGLIGRASRPLYDKPSVLIGRKGTIDRPQFMDTPFWCVDTLFYSEMMNSSVAKFLYYRFLLIDWNRHNEASGVPSLNARTIEDIEVLVPEPDEQTAIATVLSDMDAELSALQAQLDKTYLIKQAMMQELLTGRTRLPFQ